MTHRSALASLVWHVVLMDDADLSFPIILAADGTVMNGMHRVAKALRLGLTAIGAVQFTSDPPPDHIGVHPDELPYPREHYRARADMAQQR